MSVKFAVHADNYQNLNAEVRESVHDVICPYPSQLDAIEYINTYKPLGLRIIFDIPDILTLQPEKLAAEFKELKTIYGNILFRISTPNFTLLRERCNILLGYSILAAASHQEAMSLISLGVSEIYVTGALAADLDALTELRKLVRIRVIPNIPQTDAYVFGNPLGVNPLQCFWIRPEAVKRYTGIIDIMEFIFDENHDEAELISIYNQASWYGRLGDIILDHTKTLNNYENYDIELIDLARSNCGLSCQKIESICNVCRYINPSPNA